MRLKKIKLRMLQFYASDIIVFSTFCKNHAKTSINEKNIFFFIWNFCRQYGFFRKPNFM